MTSRLETIMDEIISEIHKYQSFCISTHTNPDGDAIGSQLGLAYALESLGKSVALVNRDSTPRIYRFLAGSDRIIQGIEQKHLCDLYFIIDASDASRVGDEVTSLIQSRITVNIDHHVTNQHFADLNWVEPDASSSSEMVYRLARRLQVVISPEMAECLFTGIFMDTGSFRQNNATPCALRTAGDLVELGANPSRVAREIYEKQPMPLIQMLGMALNTLEIRAEGMLAIVSITQRMFKEVGAGAEDLEGFVNYPRSIEGIEVAALLREEPRGGIKVSLRSKDSVDVSRVAVEFGGGGHQNAAGFYLDVTLEEAKALLEKAIRRFLKQRKKLTGIM